MAVRLGHAADAVELRLPQDLAANVCILFAPFGTYGVSSVSGIVVRNSALRPHNPENDIGNPDGRSG